MAATIDVGDIDSAVRANESMIGLSDQHAILAANHSSALAHGELDHAGIERILLCPHNGFSRRFNGGQIDQPPLRLRNNFVFDDENVASLKLNAPPSHRFE